MVGEGGYSCRLVLRRGATILKRECMEGTVGEGGGRKGAVILGYGVQLYLKERDYNCIQTGHTQSLDGGGGGGGGVLEGAI